MVKSKDNGDAAPSASHLQKDHYTIFTLQLEHMCRILNAGQAT